MSLSALYQQLKTSSPLEQLLEEISYQRARELRNVLHDEGGFVCLSTTAYWTDLFVRKFVFPAKEECGSDTDDLLFFVRKRPLKQTRYVPKYNTEVEVFRRDSKKLPIGDPEVDWQETVYLNLILQQFEYALTMAVCTRTGPKDLQILRKHTEKVWASPSRRQMQSKGETEEITYPNIFFMIDNFSEVFSDLEVRDGELVAVELVASDREDTFKSVIFQGSIRYEALKRVYDSRCSVTSSMTKRFTFGWYTSSQQRMEFVRMRGPDNKGHAEVAVSKVKGYANVETPSSEPGFSMTDFEPDWEDSDDYHTHHRRMSDPSSNLNTFVRGIRPPKQSPSTTHLGGGGENYYAGSSRQKARSESEGLDMYANGYTEIEAGDLRDDVNRVRNYRQGSNGAAHRKRRNTVKINQCASLKELDDTTYNRLWTMHGFPQAYHVWKESKRQQSVPVHAFLTYVTLSWQQIISDLLDHRQEPTLTF